MAPKSLVKLKLGQKGAQKAVDAADEQDIVFTSFSEQAPKFQELRRICESFDERPGKSKVACQEVIMRSTGLTLEAAVDVYRRNQATAAAAAEATGDSPPAAVGAGDAAKSETGENESKVDPPKKTKSIKINGPAKPNSQAPQKKEKDFGGFTEAQIVEYNRIRLVLSAQRVEKDARTRMQNDLRQGRLVVDTSVEHQPEPVPDLYRRLGGWWYWAESTDRDQARSLLGGQADYGFADNAEPSVQDVLNLRINVARYRSDLPDPTKDIDIIWRAYDWEQDRRKENTIFTQPVINPGSGFVPRGPGRWVWASPLKNKLKQTAAQVWQRRQLARAKNEDDPTQHLDIAWEPQVPGVYSPLSSVDADDRQQNDDNGSDDDGQERLKGKGKERAAKASNAPKSKEVEPNVETQQREPRVTRKRASKSVPDEPNKKLKAKK